MKKKGLGRGLGSLLRDEDFITDENLLTVDLDKLMAREDQPRKSFDDDSLKELANSIKADGVIQPIVVRKVDDRYEIIAGERRFRASKLAGLEKVPVVVKNVTDRKARELALVENIQREDLNPIEEAISLKTLMEEYKLTQQELSDIIGKSRSYIANNLRLLNLSDHIKEYLIRGELSPSQGRTLLSLETDEERNKMTNLLDAGFVDTFRYINPDLTDAYSWWSYMFRSREKNVGWRIDYVIVSDRIKDKIKDVKIYSEILGSDHCPVGLDIDL